MPWEDLKAIADEARELAKEERRKPITECPNDGTLLVLNQRLFEWGCTFCGYRVRA